MKFLRRQVDAAAKSRTGAVKHTFARTPAFWRRVVLMAVTAPTAHEAKRRRPHLRHARRQLKRVLLNPLVIVLSLVAVLLWGWNQYLLANRDLNTATQNLLPGGSFDNFGAGGVPAGWRVSANGNMHVGTAHPKGYVSGRALRLQITGPQDGDAELVSPEVRVNQNTVYLFKGFYTSNASFDLLVRDTYANGSSQLRLVHSYPKTNAAWTTVSDAFNSGSTLRSVQFVYRFYTGDTTQLDGTYLETNPDVDVSPAPAIHGNLFKNAAFASMRAGKPASWLTYHAGTNRAAFAFVRTPSTSYLHVAVSNYKNGEAKWQQLPIRVHAAQYFQFGVSYRSNVPADIVAEYELSSGKRRFDAVTSLRPAGEWTDVTTNFEAPSGAKTMFVSVVLHQNGSLDTAGYSLADITKPGPLQWKRPLVSLTFDGDESAFLAGVPLLARSHLPATFYVNPATIDTRNFMSTAQLETVQRRGDEIASQGYDPIDLTAVNTKRLNSEVAGSQKYLNQAFHTSTMDFASPFGYADAETLSTIRAYYRSQRGTTDGINTRQNFDPDNLLVLDVGGNTPASTVQAAVAQTEAEHGWLVIVYHQLKIARTGQVNANTGVSPANFAAQIQAIRRNGITVETVANALGEVESQH